eukprot:7117183-Pyramimonas_sp.AAC.1
MEGGSNSKCGSRQRSAHTSGELGSVSRMGAVHFQKCGSRAMAAYLKFTTADSMTRMAEVPGMVFWH